MRFFATLQTGVMAAKNKKWQVASVVLALALALVGAAHPRRLLIAAVCVAIFGCIIYVFGTWAFAKQRTVSEKIGRGILLLIAATALSVLYGSQFWPAVGISPAHVVFDPKVKNQSYSFILRNNAGDDAYSIESTFMPDSFADVKVDIPKNSLKPIVDGSKMADIAAVICEDADRRKFYLLSVPHLAPQESREILFTNTGTSNNAITANVSYFTWEASPGINDPLKMKKTFHGDQTMMCNDSLMFWLDPTHPPSKVDVQVQKNPPE